MKVVKSDEDSLVFDNGLVVESWHYQDCCESNYLDFEQLPVGTELPDYTAAQFVDALTLKEDGFSVKAKDGTPKWVQARSNQNGYYSNGVGLTVKDEKNTITVGDEGREIFTGLEDDSY